MALLSTIINGITGLGSAIGGMYAADKSSQAAKQQIASNEAIANQNLDFQKQNLQYQKDLQNTIFEREDNSYQRTAADMAAAGLNPLTMNGTNGAGEAIATSAPQKEKIDMSSKLAAFNQLASTIANVNQTVLDITKQGLEADSLQNQKFNDKVDRWAKLNDKGYLYGDSFGVSKKDNNSLKFIEYSDDNGNKGHPFNSPNFNPYNPQELAAMKRFMEAREAHHQNKYGLYSQSTDMERNLTALQQFLDDGRLIKLGDSLKDSMFDTFGLKLFN